MCQQRVNVKPHTLRTRAEAAGRAKSAVVHRCLAFAEHPEGEAHRPAARATPRATTTLSPTVTAVPITRGEGPTTTTWPRRHHPSRGESVPSTKQYLHRAGARLHTVPGRAKRSARARGVTHLPRMLRDRRAAFIHTWMIARARAQPTHPVLICSRVSLRRPPYCLSVVRRPKREADIYVQVRASCMHDFHEPDPPRV